MSTILDTSTGRKEKQMSCCFIWFLYLSIGADTKSGRRIYTKVDSIGFTLRRIRAVVCSNRTHREDGFSKLITFTSILGL